jgi:hypothetical protein
VYYTDDFRHEQFLALVLTELRLRHVPFDLAELQTSLAGVWPLVAPNDLPGRRAEMSPKSRRG